MPAVSRSGGVRVPLFVQRQPVLCGRSFPLGARRRDTAAATPTVGGPEPAASSRPSADHLRATAFVRPAGPLEVAKPPAQATPSVCARLYRYYRAKSAVSHPGQGASERTGEMGVSRPCRTKFPPGSRDSVGVPKPEAAMALEPAHGQTRRQRSDGGRPGRLRRPRDPVHHSPVLRRRPSTVNTSHRQFHGSPPDGSCSPELTHPHLARRSVRESGIH